MWYTREANLGTPYLVKRRAGWYIRIRTPADLRLAVGEHVVRTLKTSDLAIARQRALYIAARMGGVWHEMRREVLKILGKNIKELTPKDLVGCDRVRLNEDFKALPPDGRLLLFRHLDKVVARQTADLGRIKDDIEIVSSFRSALEHARMMGRVEGMREAISVGVGSTSNKHDPQTTNLADGSKLPVSQHLDAFFADQGVSPKTEQEYRVTYRKMVDVLGAVAIETITEAALIEFFAKIPDGVKARGGRKAVAAGTMQKHATALKALFNWAAGKNLCRENIAIKLKATKASQKEAKKFERRPFDRDELNRIFAAPLFTGAQSTHFLNKAGNELIRDHRFYFPLVALMTGGRLNELAQALIGDVKRFEGSPYLCITTDVDESDAEYFTPDELQEMKRLKTESAKRSIPIHPVLQRLGFMRYVEERRAEKPEDGLLFPDYDYGKLYNQRIFVNADVKTPTTSFHSLRHCYNDMLRALVHNEMLQHRLMGHAIKGAGGGKYGSALTKAEEQAFFALQPAVPLVHLYE